MNATDETPTATTLMPTYSELRCPQCPRWADRDDCPHAKPAPVVDEYLPDCQECGERIDSCACEGDGDGDVADETLVAARERAGRRAA